MQYYHKYNDNFQSLQTRVIRQANCHMILTKYTHYAHQLSLLSMLADIWQAVQELKAIDGGGRPVFG